MTQTLDRQLRPLFFPNSLATDDAGVIIPRPTDEAATFADQVATTQLLPFIRRLVNGTAKRKQEARWHAVNRQRLEMAKLCIDRALAEVLPVELA